MDGCTRGLEWASGESLGFEVGRDTGLISIFSPDDTKSRLCCKGNFASHWLNQTQGPPHKLSVKLFLNSVVRTVLVLLTACSFFSAEDIAFDQTLILELERADNQSHLAAVCWRTGETKIALWSCNLTLAASNHLQLILFLQQSG